MKRKSIETWNSNDYEDDEFEEDLIIKGLIEDTRKHIKFFCENINS